MKSPGDYHHGDLRAAVIALGLDRLASQDHPDLGLRALAREVGVSATALYRHFPNKDALMDSLALAALRRLGHHQQEAASVAPDPRQAFRASGIAYVEWARDNPALFRLIYARVGRVDALMDGSVDLGDAYRQLKDGVAAMLPTGAQSGQVLAAQLHAWSLVHGLAMLILDGQVEYDPEKVRQVVNLTDFDAD